MQATILAGPHLTAHIPPTYKSVVLFHALDGKESMAQQQSSPNAPLGTAVTRVCQAAETVVVIRIKALS